MGMMDQVVQKIGNGLATLNRSNSNGMRDVSQSEWGKKLGVGPSPFRKVARRHLRVPGGTPFTLWYPLGEDTSTKRNDEQSSEPKLSEPEVAANDTLAPKSNERIHSSPLSSTAEPAPWFKDASYFFTGYIWMLGWRYFASRPLLFTIVRQYLRVCRLGNRRPILHRLIEEIICVMNSMSNLNPIKFLFCQGFLMYFIVKVIPVHWLVVPDCIAFPREGSEESPAAVEVPDIGEGNKRPIIIFSHGVGCRDNEYRAFVVDMTDIVFRTFSSPDRGAKNIPC